jgi:hypothetical protein
MAFETEKREEIKPQWRARLDDALNAFPRPNWTLSPRQTDHPVHAKLIG